MPPASLNSISINPLSSGLMPSGTRQSQPSPRVFLFLSWASTLVPQVFLSLPQLLAVVLSGLRASLYGDSIFTEHLLHAWVRLTNSKYMKCFQCAWPCSRCHCGLGLKAGVTLRITCSEEADKAQVTATYTRSYSRVPPWLSPELHRVAPSTPCWRWDPDALGRVIPL